MEKEQLLNELKETSEENKKLHQGWHSQCDVIEKLRKENEQLKETCDGLLKIQYALADSCNKYEKALEEIREIILAECKRCNKNITSHCARCWVNNILSITNEVLEDGGQ